MTPKISENQEKKYYIYIYIYIYIYVGIDFGPRQAQFFCEADLILRSNSVLKQGFVVFRGISREKNG